KAAYSGNLTATNAAIARITTGGSATPNSITLNGGSLSLAINIAPNGIVNPLSTGGTLAIDTGATPYTAGGTNILDFSTLSGGSVLRLGATVGTINSIAPNVQLIPDTATNTLRFGGGLAAAVLTYNGIIADIAATPA